MVAGFTKQTTFVVAICSVGLIASFFIARAALMNAEKETAMGSTETS